MRKSDNRDGGRKAGDTGQLWLRLPGLVGEALYETIGVGLACVNEALEAERAALCGARYVHRTDRQALRAGHLASSLGLGGRRVAVSRPRVRSVEGPPSLSYQAGRSGARATYWTGGRWSRWCWEYRPGAMRARWNRYLKTVQVRGVSKSPVSDRFVFGTERQVCGTG